MRHGKQVLFSLASEDYVWLDERSTRGLSSLDERDEADQILLRDTRKVELVSGVMG